MARKTEKTSMYNGTFPLWLFDLPAHQRPSGQELEVFLAVFSALRPSRDGSFDRQGWATQAILAKMLPHMSERQMHVCLDRLSDRPATAKQPAGKGLLKKRRSEAHEYKDRRVVYTIPYRATTEQIKNAWSNACPHSYVDERDYYNSKVEADVQDIAIPASVVPHLTYMDGTEESSLLRSTWWAAGKWGQLTGMADKNKVGEHRSVILFRSMLALEVLIAKKFKCIDPAAVLGMLVNYYGTKPGDRKLKDAFKAFEADLKTVGNYPIDSLKKKMKPDCRSLYSFLKAPIEAPPVVAEPEDEEAAPEETAEVVYYEPAPSEVVAEEEVHENVTYFDFDEGAEWADPSEEEDGLADLIAELGG